MSNKPIKRSVAIVIEDTSGRFLAVKRAENDDSLPGVWGLPGASPKQNESSKAAAIRAGKDKLGVAVRIVEFIGEDQIDRGRFINHLKEYRATIISGRPSVPQPDNSVSQYVDHTYTDDPLLLVDAAQ